MKLLIVMVLLVFSLSGCAAAILGAGGYGAYEYLKGDVKRDYAYSYEDVWNATLKALKDDIGINIVSAKKDVFEGNIDGALEDGTKVKVEVKPIAGRLASVSIRIGTFGDKAKANMIHNYITERLRDEEKAEASGIAPLKGKFRITQ